MSMPRVFLLFALSDKSCLIIRPQLSLPNIFICIPSLGGIASISSLFKSCFERI